jgi:hypothetical protein
MIVAYVTAMSFTQLSPRYSAGMPKGAAVISTTDGL